MTLKENIVPVVNNYHAAAANSAAAAAVATTIAAAAATNGGAHQRTAANAYAQQAATSPGPAHAANGHDIYSHSPPEQGGYLQATSPQPNNAGPFQALAINRVSMH